MQEPKGRAELSRGSGAEAVALLESERVRRLREIEVLATDK